MYDTSDPRATLSTAAPAAAAGAALPRGEPLRSATVARFYDAPPAETNRFADTWYARGQNFVVASIEAREGIVFSRDEHPDEYALLIADSSTSVVVEAGGVESAVPGRSIAFVPPGRSRIRVRDPGRLIVIATSRSADLCAKCCNAREYETPDARVAALEDWPAPPDGFKLRCYSLDVPDDPGRFGRIWRCSTLMLNIFPPQAGPRDVTKLSPHHHDDFEQGSLVTEGVYAHHLRWPWTADMNLWRPDAHEVCGAPSLTVIPPTVIHTSRAIEDGINQMVDIFSPPRPDFSERPGWVLNEDDYPRPPNTMGRMP